MKKIFFYLDAVGYKFLDHMPFVKQLGEKGTLARVSVEPLHQMEFSIFSSKPQSKLNYWTWYYYNPKKSPYAWTKIVPSIFDKPLFRKGIHYLTILKEYLKGNTHLLPIGQIPLKYLRNFDLTCKKSFIDKNPIEIDTFFDVIRKNGVSYHAFEWPIHSNEKRTGIKLMGKNDFDFIKQTLKKDKKDFLFVHLTVFDSLLHKLGSKHEEIKNYLIKLDKELEKIYFQLMNRFEEVEFYVVSDHGMVDVDKKADISKAVEGLKLTYFSDSTCLRAWGDEKEIQILKTKLKELPGKIYTKDNAKDCPISFNNPYSGDLLFIVDPSYEIFPNFFNGREISKAMHGYDSTTDLDAFFVCNKKITKRDKISNIDMCPILLKSFDIPQPKEWEGNKT